MRLVRIARLAAKTEEGVTNGRGVENHGTGAEMRGELVLLGHIRDMEALDGNHGAAVGLVAPGENPQERALARAVGADQPHTLSLGDTQRDAGKERKHRMTLGDIAETQQHGGTHWRRTRAPAA